MPKITPAGGLVEAKSNGIANEVTDSATCRGCGCSDPLACVGADGLPCCWVERTLCSNCAGLTVTELVARMERQELLARLVELGLEPHLAEAPPPRRWLLLAQWDDLRVSVICRNAVPAEALLEAALCRVQLGETPADDVASAAPRAGTPIGGWM